MNQPIIIALGIITFTVGTTTESTQGASSVPDVPSYVPPSFDCAARAFALKFAVNGRLGPEKYDIQPVIDALQLQTRCKASQRDLATLDHSDVSQNKYMGHSGVTVTAFVSSEGSDTSTTGNMTHPFKTIHAALKFTRRQRRHRGSATAAIVLRGGTYFLQRPLELRPEDSHLTIGSTPQEAVTLSGGVSLQNVTWQRWQSNDTDCQTDSVDKSVWVADLTGLGITEVTGLRVDDERYVRARHPNGNPERNGLHTNHTGWVKKALKWLPRPAKPQTDPVTVRVTTPNRTAEIPEFGVYNSAIGGICNGLFYPNVSFWCNPHNPRDGAHGVWNASGGVEFHPADFPSTPWANWSHGVVHVWHDGGHWATQMYDIDAIDFKQNTVT